MSQLPQEEVEHLRRRLHLWKRLALASTSALVAVLLAIAAFFVFGDWGVQFERARERAEFNRIIREQRLSTEGTFQDIEWEK